MNKSFLISMVLLFVFLFGCTDSGITLPFTTSQLINQSTDLNYSSFKNGDYNGLFVAVDGNKLTVTSIPDFNSSGLDYVPYTGAITNVNLGLNNLYTNKININSDFGNSALVSQSLEPSTPTDYLALFYENGITPEASSILSVSNVDKALMVQGDGGAYMMGRDVTNNIGFGMGTSSLGTVFVGSTTDHSLQLRTNNITKATLTKTGDFSLVGQRIALGSGSASGTSVTLNNGGYTNPTAVNTIGAGDKIISWNSTGTKIAQGVSSGTSWFQAVSSGSGKIEFWNGETGTGVNNFTIESDGDISVEEGDLVTKGGRIVHQTSRTYSGDLETWEASAAPTSYNLNFKAETIAGVVRYYYDLENQNIIYPYAFMLDRGNAGFGGVPTMNFEVFGDADLTGGSFSIDDSENISLGTAKDASISYDGSDLIITPDVVGTGNLIVDGDTQITDSDLTLNDGNVYVNGYIHADGYITNSLVANIYDGKNALSDLDNISQWIDDKGDIDHKEHYAFVEYDTNEIIGYINKEREETNCELIFSKEEFDKNNILTKPSVPKEVCITNTIIDKIPIYGIVKHEGLDLELRISEMEKMIYELKEQINE